MPACFIFASIRGGDRVHPGVSPEVQIVAPLDDQVAQIVDHMGFLQGEHLVDDLDVLHAVTAHQKIDLLDHLLRAAVADAGLAEEGVDAAETALEGAAQAGIDGHIGLAVLDMVEAVPVVGPVFFHGQEVPGRHGQLVQILVQRRAWGWRQSLRPFLYQSPERFGNRPLAP